MEKKELIGRKVKSSVDAVKCVYKITSPSKKVYVGQTIDFNKRINQYKKLRCKNQTKLYRSFLKYGFDLHTIEIIEKCSIDKLNLKERYWQEKYDCLKNGLNCKLTTTEDKYGFLSDDTKAKISKSNKGRVSAKGMLGKNHSKETKERLKEMAIMQFKNEEYRINLSKRNTGQVLSENTKQKISKSNKNKIRSKEAKEKYSICQKGRKLSDATKNKLREINLGKKHSTETKEKMAKSHIGKRTSNKKIICIEDNLNFDSISGCARYYNVSDLKISKNANGKVEKVNCINKTFKYA